MLCPLAVYVVSGSIVASVGVNPSQDCILSRVKLPANDIQHYIPYESNPDMETMIEKTHSSFQIEDLLIPTLECTTPIPATVSTSMDNTYSSYGQH